MSSKIGLKTYKKDLLSKLLSNMAFDKVDYTNFFRSLGNVKAAPTTSDDDLIAPLKNSLLDLSKERRKVWLDWLHQYVELVSRFVFLVDCCSSLCACSCVKESGIFYILTELLFIFLLAGCCGGCLRS
jgi:hypothetical protein